MGCRFEPVNQLLARQLLLGLTGIGKLRPEPLGDLTHGAVGGEEDERPAAGPVETALDLGDDAVDKGRISRQRQMAGHVEERLVGIIERRAEDGLLRVIDSQLTFDELKAAVHRQRG